MFLRKNKKHNWEFLIMQGIRNDLQWKMLLLEHSKQIQYD